MTDLLNPLLLLVIKHIESKGIDYIDLDTFCTLKQNNLVNKRFVCNNPRFCTNDYSSFNLICSVLSSSVHKPIIVNDQDVKSDVTQVKHKIVMSQRGNFRPVETNKTAQDIPTTQSFGPIMFDSKEAKLRQKCIDEFNDRSNMRYINISTGNSNAIATFSKSVIIRDDKAMICWTSECPKERIDYFKCLAMQWPPGTFEPEDQIEGETNSAPKKKKRISQGLRIAVWLEYNGKDNNAKCYCCNQNLFALDFHCGHIVPESKGGLTELGNLRPIHSTCNTSMGATNMKDYAIKYGLKGRIIYEHF